MKTTSTLGLVLPLLALPLAALPFLMSAPARATPDAARQESTPATPDLLRRLDFLAGRWVIDGDGQYIEETWSPPRADALVGSLRWARGGAVWLYELMSIETDEEHGLVFRLRHFDRGLSPWASEADGPLTYPLADLGEGFAIFENPERDAPRRIVYRREGDGLRVTLEGAEDAQGERSESVFPFELASGD